METQQTEVRRTNRRSPKRAEGVSSVVECLPNVLKAPHTDAHAHTTTHNMYKYNTHITHTYNTHIPHS